MNAQQITMPTENPERKRGFFSKSKAVLEDVTQPISSDVTNVPVDNLKFGGYQKKLNTALVRKIAKEFDMHRMRPIEVSLRDGFYWVWDGQHRVAVYKALGFTTIPAQLHKGLKYEDEAVLFANQQVNVGRVTVLHKWSALAEGNDPATMRSIEIALAHGYTINPLLGKSSSNIIAVKSIMDIVKTLGFTGLDDILNITRKGWDSQRDAISGDILGGLNVFLTLYQKDKGFDMSTLIKKLRKKDAVSILSRAAIYVDMRSRNDRVAKALLGVYNDNRREELRLPYKFKA